MYIANSPGAIADGPWNLHQTTFFTEEDCADIPGDNGEWSG
jgi:hypothetical protein